MVTHEFSAKYFNVPCFTQLPREYQLNFLIGDHGYFICSEIGDYFNEVSKRMLYDFYSVRRECLNEDF